MSKHTQSMEPLTLTARVLRQAILARFSRDTAYSRPTVMAAGRAGGTTIVMMSSALMAISPGDSERYAYNEGNISFSFIKIFHVEY